MAAWRATLALVLLGAAACASTPATSSAPIGAAATASAAPPAPPRANAATVPHPASSAPPPAPAAPFRSEEVFDLLLRGGEVVDGTGATRRRADVVVRGDRIVVVGEVDPSVRARATLDTNGAVVAPGFVDAHAHADPVGSAPLLVAQGVTTIVVGQDGRSPGDGGDVGDWMRATEAKRPVVSFATLVGHASVRVRANVGAARVPSAAALARMVALVEDAMADGAVGLSTALEYTPGREAAQGELAAVAEPVARRDGVIMSHLRSEDDDAIEAAIDELLDQGRRSGARVHVAHLKVVGGRGAARAEALLAHLEKARAAGVSVTADWYPYTASYTGLEILFPDFARPPNDFAAARRDRKDDLRRYLRERVLARNGPRATLFGTGPFAGKTLETAASERGIAFEDVLVDLGPNGASAAYFVMDEVLQERLFLDPRVMVGSDGGGGGGHPRGAGSFARVLEELVERRRLMTLEEAVRRMTRLPSDTLRLGDDRGVVAPGAVADLVVFVPGEVRARATFTAPRLPATGMRHVVVAGQPVLLDGRATAARPGRALRAVPPPGPR